VPKRQWLRLRPGPAAASINPASGGRNPKSRGGERELNPKNPLVNPKFRTVSRVWFQYQNERSRVQQTSIYKCYSSLQM
jgi:hypothetical protein